MTRTEALDRISTRLAALDDARVLTVVDLIEAIAAEPGQPRPLSTREQTLLAQSKADFAAGRTVTIEQSRARTDALFARYAAESVKSP